MHEAATWSLTARDENVSAFKAVFYLIYIAVGSIMLLECSGLHKSPSMAVWDTNRSQCQGIYKTAAFLMTV